MTLLRLIDHEIEATVLPGSDDRVAYTWASNSHDPKTINDLLVIHKCDMSLSGYSQPAWTDEHGYEARDAFAGWQATGVGAHDLISVDPLHIEASVYWPSCCGIHGYIRDGKWTNAALHIFTEHPGAL